MSGVAWVVRVEQTTNDLVMSVPAGSAIWVAVVLAGMAWLPLVTIFTMAASANPGSSAAASASANPIVLNTRVDAPMPEAREGQGVCHAGAGARAAPESDQVEQMRLDGACTTP